LVVGAGNIYACESLFRAQIHPATRAGRISLARCQRLAVAVRDTLSDALARGGSTLKDFVASDGASGYFQIDALVYGREGLSCRRCAGTIRRIVQQQRASFYCPGCQH
jgi:formamidopyrimidine-DNA glycosylase